ncbi:TolC family protein [Ferrovibrio xuzhouensis]|uniref:TolC family protein n=1 Tax=Ferrovibrio xuzhouensis TaxID=1576914 RepID=A0ABV7VFK9_9PROT
MRFLFSVALLCAAATAAPVSAQTPTVITSLTDALRIGEDNAARLRAADAGLAGAGGALMQAGVRPNPELFVDAENFAGSKSYSGTQSLEWTAGLSQRIEIGGKRTARISEAQAGLTQAGHQRDLEALSLRADIARTYIRVLASARRVELADRQKDNAATIASAVDARVEAGKEAAVQTQRADILRATAGMAAQKARGAYQASLAELAALLNRPAGSLQLQTGWLDEIGAVPDIAPDEASLAVNPKYALITAAIERARAGIAVATAAAVPDPTLRAGFRRYNDDDSSAIVVGVSVPIPVFDRNRGAILEARQSLIRAEAEQEAARLEILGDLAKSRTAVLTAYQQVQTLKSAVEPAADRALSAARDGYQTGKFDFLNLLDAQRTRFEIEEQLAAALEEYHLARIALTTLVGRVE